MVTANEATPAEKAFAFLALLVASLPDEPYTADAGRWATAIANLRDKYAGNYPHLFRYLHFRQAPRGDSYCSEVSNLLAFLQFTDATVVYNPGFTKMQLQAGAQKLLRERYQSLFNTKDLSAMEQMSQEIAQRIKIPYI